MRRLVQFLFIGALLAVFPSQAQKRAKSPENTFRKLDRDGDGKLQLTEFQSRRKAEPNKTKKEKAFRRMDANSDGSVSLEEFTRAAERRGQRNKQ